MSSRPKNIWKSVFPSLIFNTFVYIINSTDDGYFLLLAFFICKLDVYPTNVLIRRMFSLNENMKIVPQTNQI